MTAKIIKDESAELAGVVPGLVWAFRIHDDGKAEPLLVDEAIKKSHDGWLWLHLNLADTRATTWLQETELPAAGLATMLVFRC